MAPTCSMPNLVQKIFEGFLPYTGMAAILNNGFA